MPLTGTVSGIAANSTFNVTVTDNGVVKTYVATVNSAGTAWTATIPSTDATALANGTATVSAQVTDANGNVSPLATQTVTVAETGPTVTIAAVEGNNVINATEAAAGVPLTGTVSGIAANSTFNVTVTDNGVVKTYVATVNGAGTAWTDHSLDRCHRTGERHRDRVSAGHRCQRQRVPACHPDRHRGRDRPDGHHRCGRRQQRHQCD